ncbi:HlyD family type I secretion periplasmic adaptor subunit [Ascidiaceihabitans sp.]|nr:HlyD family type I secretion periplasmic adaptor subunit [Ascidiaceihabitans sp.]
MQKSKSSVFYLWLLLLTVISLLTATLYWTAITELDLITRGSGRVIAADQNKSVEVLDTGSIISISVTEGQTVEAGQTIAVINPTVAQSSYDELYSKKLGLEAVNIRIGAEINRKSIYELSDLLSNYPDNVSSPQKQLFISRLEEVSAQKNTIEKLIEQYGQKEQELLKEQEGIKELILINREESNELLPLIESGVLGNSERYRLNRESSKLVSQIEVIAAQLKQNQIAIEKSRAELTETEKKYASSLYAEKAGTLQSLEEVNSQLPRFAQKLSQTLIKSPIKGIINQLFVNSPGTFVNSGEAIAEIVPIGEDYNIQAYVDPKDIAQIEPGQSARISLTAYDSARYGYLSGDVKSVSTDAVFREDTKSYMYAVKLDFVNELRNQDNSLVTVQPGMIAQVDIIRGRRTILEFIWQPIAKIKDDAFRQ